MRKCHSFEVISRPCLLMGTMVLAPVSARDCEVTGTLYGARVGRSWMVPNL